MPPQVWQKNHRLIAARKDLRRAKALLRDAADWLPCAYDNDPEDAHPIAVHQRKIADRILKFLDKSRGRK